jgi:hypothetical protein
MVGLLDIAPQCIQVHGVDIYGISAEGMANLFQRFPQLASLSMGKGIKVGDLVTFGPEIVAAIIAAGCGDIGNEKAEFVASKFGAEVQLDFLTTIGEMTFPSGFSPFVEKLELILETVSGEVSRVRDMKSPKVSKLSLPQDSPLATSGL